MTVAALARAMNKDFGKMQFDREGHCLEHCSYSDVLLCEFRSCTGGAAQHHRGTGLAGARLGLGGQMDQGGGDAVWHEVPLGQTERQQRESQPGRSAQVHLLISGADGPEGGLK